MNTRLVTLLVATAALTYLQSPGIARQPSAPVDVQNFDIRLVKTQAADAYVARLTSIRSAVDTSRLLATRAAGLAQLRATYPSLTVVNNPALGLPATIGRQPGTSFLSGPGVDRVATLRAFLGEHASAFGMAGADTSSLHLAADYQNPSGSMAWAELDQRVNGLPIFQATVRGGFTAAGHLVRTTGTLVPVADAGALPTTPSLSAPHAIALAAAHVGWQVDEAALTMKATDEAGRISFSRASLADDARAWRLYFPVAPGVLRLAWATEIIGDPMAYLSIIDALDGTLLFRKNLTNFQSQPATYVVYTGDSPAPLSPTTAIPGANVQPGAVPRTSIMTTGNDGNNAFNLLGWMTDGANETDGNNVQAGLDGAAPDGIDATVTGSGRVFNFAYDPAPGLLGPPQAPTEAGYRNGEVTNMFYWTNVYHDRLYNLGFTEAARNFQHDNFDRGGIAGDRISAEAQDYSGVDNANFTTPSDGGRGRMQMYRFTGPNPDRSSGIDQDILIHELTHGTSNRLHANGSGLDTYMAAGMGEGWSDFYARALLATADEDVNAVYAMAAWSTLQMAGEPYTDNYYYGIRRFPYAVMSTVGGPSSRPYNPLTFADVDSAEDNLSDGAYPPNPLFASNPVDGVHNQGEVWASALFEIRARFIARLGFAAGNQHILQLVTDAMKLDPGSPTMLDGRDSLLVAASASGTVADILDIWQGFATRGMGVSASVQNTGNGAGGARVTEAFDVPGLTATSATMVSEAAPNGRLDAGELVGVELCVTNHSLAAVGPATGTLLANATLASPSAPQDFGTVPSGGSACRTFTFVVAASCGGTVEARLELDAPQGDATAHYQFDTGLLAPFYTETFDSVGAGALPAGWTTATLNGIANLWGASTTFASSAPNSVFAPGLAAVSDNVLVSPPIVLPAGGSRLTFNNHFETEWRWDGGVLEISIDSAPYQDIIAAGGTFVRNGYTTVLLTGSNNPIAGRRAWTGGSLQPVITAIDLPMAAAGKAIRLRWRMASDEAVNGVGWGIDDVTIGQLACSIVVPPTANNDAYGATANLPLNVPSPGVLGNDVNEPGSATLVSNVSHGTLALAADGSFSYTPAADFVGIDQFTYETHNLVGASNVATVTIIVAGVTPTAADDAYGLGAGTVLTVPAAGVLANDSGTNPLTATLVTTTSHGTLALAAGGGFTYTPSPTFAGSDSFTYRATNMAGASNNATVRLTVTAQPAVAIADSYATASATPLAVAAPGVLLNDTGTAPLTATLVSDVTHGTLALATDGSFTYTPAPTFSGTDTFTYRAGNVLGAGTTTTVTLTVAAPTTVQPPTALYVESVVGTTVQLRWTPPAIGPAPTGFVIEGGVAPGEVLASVPTGTTAPGFVFAAPKGAFYVRVHSIAGAERSAASNEVRLFVDTPTPPSAPANVLATAVGSTVALRWRNTYEGGAPTSLVLDVTGEASGSLPFAVMESSVVDNVQPGTYTLRLRATNAAGTSTPSDPVTVTVPGICTGTPQPPANLQVGRVGTVAYVLWDLPAAGPAPLSFIVSVSGSYVGALPLSGRSVFAAIGSGSYYISVQAVNACGVGAATPTQVITVP